MIMKHFYHQKLQKRNKNNQNCTSNGTQITSKSHPQEGLQGGGYANLDPRQKIFRFKILWLCRIAQNRVKNQISLQVVPQ